MDGYYDTTLLPFVDSFIRENANRNDDSWDLDLQDFDPEELEVFASHLIRLDIDQGEPWLWLNDAKDANSLGIELAHYLATSNSNIKQDFIHSISHIAVTANLKRMQRLIDERIADNEIDYYNDNGLKPYKDNINGEVTWML